MLQCVIVCCSVLQRVAVCCNVLQCVTTSRLKSQYTATHCSAFTRLTNVRVCVCVREKERQRERENDKTSTTEKVTECDREEKCAGVGHTCDMTEA